MTSCSSGDILNTGLELDGEQKQSGGPTLSDFEAGSATPHTTFTG